MSGRTGSGGCRDRRLNCKAVRRQVGGKTSLYLRPCPHAKALASAPTVVVVFSTLTMTYCRQPARRRRIWRSRREPGGSQEVARTRCMRRQSSSELQFIGNSLAKVAFLVWAWAQLLVASKHLHRKKILFPEINPIKKAKIYMY